MRHRAWRNSRSWTAPCAKPLIAPTGQRQCSRDRDQCRMTNASRDIAIRPQQIGRACYGVVALLRQSLRIDEAAAADANEPDIIGQLGRAAIGKRQQRETPALSAK